MKHRIRKTGEIISVIDFRCTTEERSTDRVSYVDSKGYHHTDVQMNYYWDLEEVDETKEIDWEHRRYEIAKEALSGMISIPISLMTVPRSSEEYAVRAVKLADELIKQLKNK